MRHVFFPALPAFLLLSAFAPGAAMASGAPPASTETSRAEVTETVQLTNAKPSDLIQTLRQQDPNSTAVSPKPGIADGIQSVLYDDFKKTITVQGSAQAVANLKAVLLLMDVEPKYLNVRIRLIETRPGEDGKLRETILESQTLTIANNRSAHIRIPIELRETTSFSITPHLNGDKTVSITAVIGDMSRYGGDPQTPPSTHASTQSNVTWLRKPGEWKILLQASVMYTEQLQKAGLARLGPTAETYYLPYRWEIMASERVKTTSP